MNNNFSQSYYHHQWPFPITIYHATWHFHSTIAHSIPLHSFPLHDITTLSISFSSYFDSCFLFKRLNPCNLLCILSFHSWRQSKAWHVNDLWYFQKCRLFMICLVQNLHKCIDKATMFWKIKLNEIFLLPLRRKTWTWTSRLGFRKSTLYPRKQN